MPEGDSLVRLAHRLRPIMRDETIERSDFRTPKLATVDLAGWLVTDISPTAKYLSMTVNAPGHVTDAAHELVVLSHLGMDGSWQIDTRPSHRTRCILRFAEHSVVADSLMILEVLTPEQVAQQLAYLGPDLLDPAWEDPQAANDLLVQALENFRQAPDQPIGTALLDQHLVSGIGNIYRCEVLLVAGLNPHRQISELTDEQLTGLILLARDLMVLNVPPRSEERTRRRTVDVREDPTAPFGVRVATALEQARSRADRARSRRDPNFWVYGRDRQGCLRCGGPVRVEKLGTKPDNTRDLHWCPNCQQG
ncbi:MAG TPA: DNA-formamidopyrimidine glycosylase family protein [Enteractinococcus sp.]